MACFSSCPFFSPKRTMSTDCQAQSTVSSLDGCTTRKERTFQVVPVPGEFKRGRWKCVDTRFKGDVHKTTGVFAEYPEGKNSIAFIKGDTVTVTHRFRRAEPSTSTRHGSNKEHMGNLVASEASPSRICSTETHRDDVISVTVVDTTPSTEQSSVVVVSQEDGSAVQQPQHGVTAANEAVVNIDNKIVQAMDLVKTHLTFAVREEVETLKTHITELQAKLNQLRAENRYLRENVPSDVVASLSSINLNMLQDESRSPGIEFHSPIPSNQTTLNTDISIGSRSPSHNESVSPSRMQQSPAPGHDDRHQE